MPDLEITIGDRKFYVSCRVGEEHFLNAAAKLLDSEATPLQAQMGRLPEARMLLMAGLMLADRTASLEDELRQARAKLAELHSHAAAAPAADSAGIDPAALEEQRQADAALAQALAQLASRAETLADHIEERIA